MHKWIVKLKKVGGPLTVDIEYLAEKWEREVEEWIAGRYEAEKSSFKKLGCDQQFQFMS